jgi:hypothetical protein
VYTDESNFEDREATPQFVVEEQIVSVVRDTDADPYAERWSDTPTEGCSRSYCCSCRI